jgi:hypothetical protein
MAGLEAQIINGVDTPLHQQLSHLIYYGVMKTISPTPQGVKLSIRGLCKSYHGNEVLKGINLDVNAGEIFVIMSMQAQAERERQARVIPGDAERQIAEKFAEAGKTYDHNPVAFHLRAMNMLYEGLKKNARIVIVPSTAVESMQPGGLAGMTALTMGLGPERANGHKEKGG